MNGLGSAEGEVGRLRERVRESEREGERGRERDGAAGTLSPLSDVSPVQVRSV